MGHSVSPSLVNEATIFKVDDWQNVLLQRVILVVLPLLLVA